MPRRPLVGVFVGGASRRMGGAPKGLLRLASGETVVNRWLRVLSKMELDCVLVGSRAEYAPRPMLPDALAAGGPLGGLVALLQRAADDAGVGPAWAVAVACDMPHVSEALVGRLLAAPYAAALAPRTDGRWEPMLARYDAARALPVATARANRGELSMQGLLEELGATPLALTEAESSELHDWDTVEDVKRRPA